jgi:hypothetical protein
MEGPMKYQVSQVQQWGEELDALPAPEPGSRMVGKREAVLLLADKLQSAARRGVSRAALLEALEAKGIKVHLDLLREALKHVGKVSGHRRARAPKKDGFAPATTATEHQEKDRPADEPGNTELPAPEPADGGSRVGVTASAEPGSAADKNTGGGRIESRSSAGKVTAIEATATSEAIGANFGAAQASGKVEGPTGPRTGRDQTRSAGTDAEALRAPGAQSRDEARKPGAARSAEAPAEPAATTARQVQSEANASGKTEAAPAGRGSFIPRSDSDVI